MAIAEFTVSLRVEHPTRSHASVIQSLGLEAEFSHTVGEKRVTPKGRQLEGYYKETYCSFIVIEKQSGDLVAGIRTVVQLLDKKKDVLKAIASEGGRSELFVGVFAKEIAGFILKAKDMQTLADFSLDLSVEFYLGE